MIPKYNMSDLAAAKAPAAPPLQISSWVGVEGHPTLADFRGRVLLIEAFQMLCPGCVSVGLPQAQRVQQAFDQSQVAVIGLHTVFEHHAAQGPRGAIEAFAHEYRLTFPIGIDAPGTPGGIPLTMQAYAMRGTPTLILIDRQGRLRMQRFGHVDDLALGSALTTLLLEAPPQAVAGATATPAPQTCDANGCAIATAA